MYSVVVCFFNISTVGCFVECRFWSFNPLIIISIVIYVVGWEQFILNVFCICYVDVRLKSITLYKETPKTTPEIMKYFYVW